MPYISINNFKFGLDGRRSELSSVQGTLLEALDGHINQGGEFEKRKAFTRFNNTTRPASTFGLEVTTTGLTIFGSVAKAGAAVAGTSLQTLTGYANVYYQKLTHPSSLFGNATPPALSSILCSTSFGGKTWCVGKFTDNFICAFYDGIPIPAWYNGVVLTGANSQQDIANQLAAMLSTITGLNVGAVTIGSGVYTFQLSASGQFNYTPVVNVTNSALGTLQANILNSFIPGVVGAAATSTFTIEAGTNTGGGGISGITCNGVALFVGTVLFQAGDTTSAFATRVVTAIASYNSSSLVTAAVSSNVITLSYPIAQGITPNGNVLIVTAVGDCCIDDTIFNFTPLSTGSGISCTSVQIPSNTSFVPPGTNYGVGGTVGIGVLTIGTVYCYQKGPNDTNINYGGGTLTNSGTFTATATGATLTGLPSVAVTAQVTAMEEILGATVTGAGTTAAFVTAIAAQIRSHNVATACGSSLNLFVSRKVCSSANPVGNFALIILSAGVPTDGVTGGSGGTIGPPPLVIQSVASPTNFGTSVSPITAPYSSGGSIAISVTGGVPPYTYAWLDFSGESGSGSSEVFWSVTSALTLAKINYTIQAVQNLRSGSFIATCTVKDSGGTTTVSKTTISFNFT